MSHARAVVAFWSLMEDVAGLSPFTVMTNIFVTEFADSSENIQGKLEYIVETITTTWNIVFFVGKILKNNDSI